MVIAKYSYMYMHAACDSIMCQILCLLHSAHMHVEYIILFSAENGCTLHYPDIWLLNRWYIRMSAHCLYS